MKTFEEHRSDWLSKHRSSVPSKARVSSGLASLGTWFLTFAGAAAFSAAHTIPTLYYLLPTNIPESLRWIIAACGFLATDLLIYLTAFFKDKGRIVKITQILALTVAVTANTFSELQIAKSPFEQAIAIIFGCIFPMIVYCAGEMSNRAILERAEHRVEADKQYRKDWQELEAKILAAYTKETRVHEPDNSSRDVHETVHEPKRERVNLRELAVKIRENGHENMSTEEMMEEYGISKGGTTKIRKILQE